MTPRSTTLSYGVQGAIDNYNIVMFVALAAVFVIAGIIWFRRR